MNTTADSARPADSTSRDVATAYSPLPVWRGVIWAFVALMALHFTLVVLNNPNFGWDIVIDYFFDGSVMRGLWVTLWLAVVSMVLGIALGLLIGVARMSNDVLISNLAYLYIWFFRGTPLLVQLIFWYNFSMLFPRLELGIPFGGPVFASWDTNTVITPLTAAIAGLALNQAATMAEIFRGGLLSVDRNQVEACEAFGMSRARALWRIILPQAMRAIVPPTGNEFISMIKATSLVSVIAMADLLYSVQMIYNRTFEVIPMLMIAVIWYLLVTSVLNVGQGFIERYYGRSDRDIPTAGKDKA